MTSIASFDQSPLLEIRTDAGAIYLCPSRFQRIRLQWTFRHFHVLPPQLLSRHDQRLIERLSQSAVVTPRLPVTSEAILGVVEKAAGSSAHDARVTDDAAFQDQQPVPQPAQRWVWLAAMAAVPLAVTMLLTSVHGIHRQTPVLPVAPAFTPQSWLVSHSATTSLLALATAAAPAPMIRPRRLAAWPDGLVAQSARTASLQSSPGLATSLPEVAPAERLWLTELPPGHFAHPIVARRNLAGEVELQALIASDGSVTHVTVLRGNRELAEAGIRAVRQWQYNPFAIHGTPVEAETRIRMNFFGADAVSIASVAR